MFTGPSPDHCSPTQSRLIPVKCKKNEYLVFALEKETAAQAVAESVLTSERFADSKRQGFGDERSHPRAP